MNKKLVPVIIGVMALVTLCLGILLFMMFREIGADYFRYGLDDSTEFGDISIDSGARIEIEILRSELLVLKEKVRKLENKPNSLPSSISGVDDIIDDGKQDQDYLRSDGTNNIIDSYAQVVSIANRRKVNGDLRIASPSYLESILGKPRGVLTNKCQGMTNSRLTKLLVTKNVGPIRVRMLRPAIDSLDRIFQKIEAADPDLYARINSSGALCVRHIRGAPNLTSTHAFGLSLDLNIDGRLDQLGDGKTQLGLTILADFFRTEGWYWGAGFSREDSMHFEVSRSIIEKWVKEGSL